MSSITLPAYAKMNLYLAVTGREPNGYHSVETVMQALSLHDLVTVETGEPGDAITLTCQVPAVPCDSSNLVWCAAEHFFDDAPHLTRRNLHIHIEKQIPVAGGLAGGSTDAAAALIALNRLYGEPLTRDSLLAIAAGLGADVPFCVLSGLGIPTALGLHYGERMTPLPALPPLHAVAVSHGEGCPTPWAYSRIDTLSPDRPGGYLPLIDALSQGDTAAVLSEMYNIFEDAVYPERPLALACRQLLAASADCAMLSGSGSTVVGLFTDEGRAASACAELQSRGAAAFLCRTLTADDGSVL